MAETTHTSCSGTIAQCIIDLKLSKNSTDLELAISNVSNQSVGSELEKEEIQILIGEIMIDAKLVDNSKVRRRLKRLKESFEEKPIIESIEEDNNIIINNNNNNNNNNNGYVAPVYGEPNHVMEWSKANIGRVIGRGGETIQHLQNTTGAYIKIIQDSDPCIINIFGNEDMVNNVTKMINEIMDKQNRREKHANMVLLRESLPPQPTGPVIHSSSGGTMEQCIIDLNAAKVSSDVELAISTISNQSTGTENERTEIKNLLLVIMENTELSGNSKVKRRLKRLADSIEEIPEIIKSEPIINNNVDTNIDNGYINNRNYEKPSKTIECLKQYVGRVIGRGGETILMLQNTTGAYIKIMQATEPCEIVLSGNESSIAEAETMINEIINKNIKENEQQQKWLKKYNKFDDNNNNANDNVDSNIPAFIGSTCEECIKFLIEIKESKTSADVETVIASISSLVNANKETKDESKILLTDMLENKDLVSNAKIRRKVKRLLDSINEQASDVVVGNQNISSSNNNNNCNDIVDSNNPAFIGSTSEECIKFLIEIKESKTSADVETAIPLVSSLRNADSKTKKESKIILNEIIENEDLISNAKIRRKIKRLIESIEEKEVELEKKEKKEKIKKKKEPKTFDPNSIIVVYNPPPGAQLEDVIEKINNFKTSKDVEMAIENVKEGDGTTTTRRKLKRKLEQIITNESNKVIINNEARDKVKEVLNRLVGINGNGSKKMKVDTDGKTLLDIKNIDEN
jgi:rRNA processing protein Krr1/Pno1